MTFDEIAMEGIIDKLDEGLSKNRAVATVINFINRCIEAIGRVLTKILPRVMESLNQAINHGAVNVSSNVILNYKAASRIWSDLINSTNAMKAPYHDEAGKSRFTSNTNTIDGSKEKLEKILGTLEESIKASNNERSVKVEPSTFNEMMAACKKSTIYFERKLQQF